MMLRASNPPRQISHGDVMLALHELRDAAHAAARSKLLLLHQLTGSSDEWGAELDDWPGPVYALDFAGHGASSWRAGGAYTPELFAADADAALAALGPCHVAGRGLGAYVALLVAGARPDLVPAAILLAGEGLAGGLVPPDSERGSTLLPILDDLATLRGGVDGFDPMVRSCLSDIRPPDYACGFASSARSLLLAEDGRPRPPWWEALHEVPSTRRVTAELRKALVILAREV